MRISRLATVALSALVALLLAAPAADAGQRGQRARQGAPKSGQSERTVTRTRPDGTSRTSTHESTWQRGDGQWSRDTVHTGPGGKQGSTHVEGSKTENGHVRDVTRTGPGGKTVTTHDEVERTGDGYTRQTTHTGPKGGVTTRDVTGSYDPAAKTWTKDASVTRPDGTTTTSHKVVTRPDAGVSQPGVPTPAE